MPHLVLAFLGTAGTTTTSMPFLKAQVRLLVTSVT